MGVKASKGQLRRSPTGVSQPLLRIWALWLMPHCHGPSVQLQQCPHKSAAALSIRVSFSSLPLFLHFMRRNNEEKLWGETMRIPNSCAFYRRADLCTRDWWCIRTSPCRKVSSLFMLMPWVCAGFFGKVKCRLFSVLSSGFMSQGYYYFSLSRGSLLHTWTGQLFI